MSATGVPEEEENSDEEEPDPEEVQRSVREGTGLNRNRPSEPVLVSRVVGRGLTV